MSEESQTEKEEEIPDLKHCYCTAASVMGLQLEINKRQEMGYELVSIVRDDDNWYAFMKRGNLQLLQVLARLADEINNGIAMLLDNHQGLVTAGRIDDLQEIVQCILQVLEDRKT